MKGLGGASGPNAAAARAVDGTAVEIADGMTDTRQTASSAAGKRRTKAPSSELGHGDFPEAAERNRNSALTIPRRTAWRSDLAPCEAEKRGA